jgi:uncharacterized protein (DUF488 family)
MATGHDAASGDGPRASQTTLLTFGHGVADRDALTALLDGAGVRTVVDVRTAPGSRRNPAVNRDALAAWLPAAGIAYRWEPRLGGFRRPAPDSPDTFWENDAFRGYAAHTREPDFVAAVDELLEGAASARTAVMCAETVWWRCHRRIIADFAVLAREVRVLHLMPGGQLRDHQPAAGARVRDDGLLVYDRPH